MHHTGFYRRNDGQFYRFARCSGAYNLQAIAVPGAIGLVGAGGVGGRSSRSPRAALFLSFLDGKRRFSDTVGQELRGLAAARQHAVQQVRELKLAMCDPHIQDLSGWSMTVADARSGTVFEIGFDLGNQGSQVGNR